jgi:hypothetical protein
MTVVFGTHSMAVNKICVASALPGRSRTPISSGAKIEEDCSRLLMEGADVVVVMS